MNRFRHAGASESYVTTTIFLAIADFRVGQSAEASVAETISAFAPFVIAAWIAGICDAAVACVPLVSVPVSFRSLSALSAPPDLTLSAVVKYGLPRFFGITNTFRPVLSAGAADAVASNVTPRTEIAPIAVMFLMKRVFTLVSFPDRGWCEGSGAHALSSVSATSLSGRTWTRRRGTGARAGT